MGWVYLIAAIMLEVAGTTCIKLSNGFARFLPSVLVFVFYGLSLSVLVLAIGKIPISVGYAVWSGLGTAMIAVIGVLYFRESLDAVQIVSLALIIAGVVGLNLRGAH